MYIPAGEDMEDLTPVYTSSCNSLESHYSSNDAEDNEYQCYPANDSRRVDAELAGIRL